jgi:hypothetical protein
MWHLFDELIAARRFITSEEVLRELGYRDMKPSSAAEYAKSREGFVVPVDVPQCEIVTEIVNAHPNLVNVDTWKNSADPFVVALACVRNAVVVTQETFKSMDHLNVPMLCLERGITPITLINLMDELALDY